MPQLWEVVGGADKGGILVREGKETASPAVKDRLATGSILEEIELVKERLNFKRISGSGPETGWISIKLPGKDLAVRYEGEVDGAGGDEAAEGGEDTGGEPKRVPPPFKHVQEPQIEYLQIRELAAKNEPGDYYGMTFPHSMDQIVSKDFGPSWLTKAFHKSGVLPKSNAVTKIKDAKEFVGGGAGLKCIIKVEYKKDESWLHKELFIKLPHKPGGSDRYYVSCMWRHDRPETIFNIWLEQYVPFRVPKFYFGDISAGTTNFVLITENIQWKPKGTKTFGPGDVEPAYDKYMDWELPDGGPMYYTASCQALGKMAGLHRIGQLHPKVNEMFPMPEPCTFMHQGVPARDANARKGDVAKADQLIRFLTETAKRVYPDECKDKAFLEKWKDDLMNFMDYSYETGCFCMGYGDEDPNAWVGLTHNNLQIDNAFFFHDAEGKLEVGLLDWGVLACGPLIGAIQGCISGAQKDVLLGHRDGFLKAFIDSYAESGGPRLDFDRLLMMSNIQMMNWCGTVISNVSQVLKFTKQKEWDTITDWNDDKLIGRFQTRAHCTQFKYAIQLWREWDLAEWFKTWCKIMGLPERKS